MSSLLMSLLDPETRSEVSDNLHEKYRLMEKLYQVLIEALAQGATQPGPGNPINDALSRVLTNYDQEDFTELRGMLKLAVRDEKYRLMTEAQQGE